MFADSAEFAVSGLGTAGNPFTITLAEAIRAVATPCTSTTRPTDPVDGQIIYEHDTFRLLFWPAAIGVWRALEAPAFLYGGSPPPSQYPWTLHFDATNGMLVYSDGTNHRGSGTVGPHWYQQGTQLSNVATGLIVQSHIPGQPYPCRARIDTTQVIGVGGTAGEIQLTLRHKSSGGITSSDTASDGGCSYAYGAKPPLDTIKTYGYIDLAAGESHEVGVTIERLSGDAVVSTSADFNLNKLEVEIRWR